MTNDRADIDREAPGGGEAPARANSAGAVGDVGRGGSASVGPRRGTASAGARDARLSAALRANLARRKQQLRDRKDVRKDGGGDEPKPPDLESPPES